jgi:type IV pilus assembly protein PilA
MTKLIRNNQKGFTLIELMIVVAIIGILAAIAIPNFLSYQLKSKTAEAKTNIGGIKASQEAFRAEYDFYANCADNPGIAGIGPEKQVWTINAAANGSGWEEIGYEPAGSVYYTYQVTTAGSTSTNLNAIKTTMAVGTCGDGMIIGAAANLDGNATNGEFAYIVDDGAGIRLAKPANLATAIPALAVAPNNSLQDLVPNEY